ncbi:CYTH and CHAD domain-containing protein [Nonomuraea sp. NEAU-A123]|uniref:CYTH and CHAD domain-containing protein n=1 Tax=Nonomuraea sp. NEAU-A123 TaxID=2839649 RepID=UPI001BE49856|nr:CYTH and CHAD domain-containing protein [Nonomuraea sp. NEAU-A123]MBT2231454.1 CYTH and CHAD domain-containing protein [Nonomuraea sp. NEAU-A123]
MTSHVEIERKYDVDGDVEIAIEDFTGPDGEVTADEPETWRLVAEYVDTAALTLASHGITLRRRQGGEDAGWHLKLPMAKGARREVHAPLGADVHHVPVRLAELVAAHVRGHELVPVVTLETTRTVRRLRGQGGKVVAEVADDQVVGRRLGRDRRPASWREIEVELVDGSTGLLDAVESRLREAGATPSPSVSKLARVLGDDLPPAADRGSGRSAGAALVAYLRRQREHLLGYDPLVRLADHDDDTVHKMRVAVRRMRSVLRTHSRLLDGDRVAPLEAELRWLAGELGTVRDLEVLTARFDRRLTGRPQDGPENGGLGNARWPGLLAARESKARQALKRTLSAPRYFTLLAAVDDFIADPPFQDRAGRKASRQTPRLVARSWRKVLTRYTEAQRLPEGAERDRALHSTRKAAKRARYTAEAAAPVLGKPAKKLAKQAERLQETLGRRQDALVAQRELTQLATRPGLRVADAFTLGLLLADERHAADAALRDLAPVWKKAAKPGLLNALNA